MEKTIYRIYKTKILKVLSALRMIMDLKKSKFQISDFLEKYHKCVVILFFILILFLGLNIYKDYGISWDETAQRETGLTIYNYVFEGNQALLEYKDRDYGAGFELPLIMAEKLLNLDDSRDIYLMRHLANFLLFYLSVIFFYLLCKEHFNDWKMGLFGSLLLILSPRIFADAFYNSKDLAFLSVFIISIYTLIKFLEKASLYRTLAHSLVCAVLIDLRIMGILVPALSILFVSIRLCYFKDIKIKGYIICLLGLIISLIFLVILFWPWLWSNPVNNFIQAFINMHKFRWGGSVLYLGEYVNAAKLPWHYLPVWIIITTPILYTFNFFIGLFSSIKKILKNPFGLEKRNNLIFILWFFLPLIAAILLKSVVYDGWRHLYFIYPAFILISLYGLLSLFKFAKIKFSKNKYKIVNICLVLIISLSLISTAVFMVKYHPYQNLYFNVLAGNNIGHNFELDYWGLSYRKGLEYILKTDSKESIAINAENPPGKLNILILPEKDRNRLNYTENKNESDYFITNFRWQENIYPSYPYEHYYSITVGKAKILEVYKIKPRNA